MRRSFFFSRTPEAGVTLVEMLVALAIFALIGTASFTTLDTIIRTRDRTEGRLEIVAALDRALILVSRDLGQSDPGSHEMSGAAFSFGLSAAGGPADMHYTLIDGAFVRGLGEESEDERENGLVQHLIEGVISVTWRALDRAGEWHDSWPPEETHPALAGIELVLTLEEDGPTVGLPPLTLRRLVDLPLGMEP